MKMEKLKTALFVVILIACTVLCQQIVSRSIENQHRKQDYSEINHIKYGLFSINEWKKQLSEIVNAEISELSVRENEKQIRPMLEAQLNALIDGVDKKIREKNSKSVKGKLKQAFINTFVDIKDIKAGIPEYADSIMKIMERPKTKKTLKNLLADKVEEYFEKTFEEQDLSQVETIMGRMQTDDIQVAKDRLNQEILQARNLISVLSWVMIGLAALAFASSGLSRLPLPSAQYITLTLILLMLLIAGVTTPMIDLEAKISEMSFVLFDHPIKFVNQILYFQTKSVLDVFWIMITHQDLQMKVVGVLMVAFSVIFPVLKLLSTIAYYYNHRGARDSKWIQFFVLKSGKWSMTDVMIIAIFMAYIGFNGIISSQLGKLHAADQEIVLLTTNGTSLQPGFYLFMSYAVLALFLSEFLTRQKSVGKPLAREKFRKAELDFVESSESPSRPAPEIQG